MANKGLIKSSLVKKYWMAGTGLFLCIFLIGHLIGNLQLLVSGMEGKLMFNEYALFMTSNPIVKILSYLTYASILFHAIDGIVLTVQNKKARPVKYVHNKPEANSKWASRNMALLGVIVLAFIAGHMANFWYVMHFDTAIPMMLNDADGNLLEIPLKDLHEVVMSFFNPEINSLAALALAFYVLSMVGISFHLSHGFQSAFQSMGLNHPKYTPIIKKTGAAFSIIVPAAFAIIPLYIFFA
jgi:succinate dehydrogenase / fumarate reductase cytochrome b subunit